MSQKRGLTSCAQRSLDGAGGLVQQPRQKEERGLHPEFEPKRFKIRIVLNDGQIHNTENPRWEAINSEIMLPRVFALASVFVILGTGRCVMPAYVAKEKTDYRIYNQAKTNGERVMGRVPTAVDGVGAENRTLQLEQLG